MLVISWKMGAATMGYFTKDEWMGGMRKMKYPLIPSLLCSA